MNFYYRYAISLKTSIDNRQARIDALYSNQHNSIRRGGASLEIEATKLRDTARGLLCEYQELSSEIQVRLIDNIAVLAMQYSGDTSVWHLINMY